ncbi:MAG TPA: hypothetical protein DCF66_04000 [Lachnospiraceae bacterium]|nr:hypothetical protein [Lachnospiraceae bacterium]HCG60741.1 hypothetical protein [Lachnospiraceae bacterium]
MYNYINISRSLNMNLSIFIRISLFNNTYLRYDEAIKVHILQVTVRDRVFFLDLLQRGVFSYDLCLSDRRRVIRQKIESGSKGELFLMISAACVENLPILGKSPGLPSQRRSEK